jgi:hypothetical protein
MVLGHCLEATYSVTIALVILGTVRGGTVAGIPLLIEPVDLDAEVLQLNVIPPVGPRVDLDRETDASGEGDAVLAPVLSFEHHLGTIPRELVIVADDESSGVDVVVLFVRERAPTLLEDHGISVQLVFLDVLRDNGDHVKEVFDRTSVGGANLVGGGLRRSLRLRGRGLRGRGIRGRSG